MRFLDEEGLQLLWSNIIAEIDSRFSLLDQENIVQEVIAALGTPVFGTVDENNNITLTGELKSGTYTLKYEGVGGDVTNIGTIEITTSTGYTNLIPLSINSDGSSYVGDNGEDGYRVGYRLNSSGVETSATGVNITGYIPVKAGDTVYIKNANISMTATGGLNDYTYLAVYNSNFENSGSNRFTNITSSHDYLYNNFVTDDNGYLTSFYVNDRYGNISYMRISAPGITDQTIITVNEPIVDSGITTTYTNVLPLTINSDGTLYSSGQGWKTDTRLNSSGIETSETGIEVTGFIPVTYGNTLYFKNIECIYNDAYATKCYFCAYDSNFTYIASTRMDNTTLNVGTTIMTFDENNNVQSLILANGGGFSASIDNIAYLRFSASDINADSIVTVNEPIE